MTTLPVRLSGIIQDPIVVREGRARTRSSVTSIGITVALGAVAAVACTLFAMAAAGAPEHRPNAAQMARVAYHATSFQVGLVMLLAPVLAASTIAGERERYTLDLLVMGRFTPWRIVRAKALAAVSYVLLFVAAAAPFYVAIFLHAGLGLGHLALAELVTVAAAVVGVSLGVFLSALCPRTRTAAVAASGLALALCLDVVLAGVVPVPGLGLPQTRRQLLDGTFVAEAPFDDITDASRGGAGGVVVHPVRLSNPLTAVHQLIAQPDATIPVGQLGRSLVPGGEGDSTWGIGVKAWQLALVAQLAASALLLALASRLIGGHVLSPARVRRRRRPSSTASP